MFEPKRILVPTDFSEFSNRALSHAIDVATRFGAQIYLLHVIEEWQYCAVDYCFPKDVAQECKLQSRMSAIDRLKEEARLIGESQGIEIIQDVKVGTPYETILNVQKEKEIDLIVIASHGKTGLLAHLIGGVAEKVLRSATCPVLLVK